jgi:hypothetical protein
VHYALTPVTVKLLEGDHLFELHLFNIIYINIKIIVEIVYFRIESYSCKMAGNEKQMYKKFNSEQGVNPNDLQALSPPQTGVSPGQSYYR